jgi:hypothetical protein
MSEAKELILPGLENVQDSTADEASEYKITPPTVTKVRTAFVVYAEADGTWTATSLRGTATVSQGARPDIEIESEHEASIDEFYGACSTVLCDIQAAKTADVMLMRQQMMMQQLAAQQHAQAIAQKLSAQGIRVPGQ